MQIQKLPQTENHPIVVHLDYNLVLGVGFIIVGLMFIYYEYKWPLKWEPGNYVTIVRGYIAYGGMVVMGVWILIKQVF